MRPPHEGHDARGGPARPTAGSARAPALPSAMGPGGAHPVDRVMALHHALGNRAFAQTFAPRVLARDAVKWKHNTKLDPGEPDRLYNQAVKDGDWQLLLGVINSFADDADVGRLLAPIERQGTSGLMTAQYLAINVFQWRDDHPIRRALAFLMVKGDVGRRARAERTTAHHLGAANGAPSSVPGGTVSIYDAVQDPRGARNDEFALQYQGTDAENTGWIQFVAPEVEAFDAGEGGEGDFINGTMTGRYQDEQISYGSSTSPNWSLDSSAEGVPFYESPNKLGLVGVGVVSYGKPGSPATAAHPATPPVPGEITMIDRPQQDPSIVKKAFSKGARRVERRLRFHEYLVRGEDVLFENELVVQDTYWHPEDVPVRKNILGKRGLADRLQAPHFQALIRRHPRFSYFAHDVVNDGGD